MTDNNEDEFEAFQKRFQQLRNDGSNNSNFNPGEYSGDSAQNDVASDLDKNSVYHDVEPNAGVDLNRLFEAMLIENKRRDAFMEKILDKVMNQSNNSASNGNLSLMPEVLRNIKSFNGDTRQAETWLKSLKSAKLLHNLPDSYILETARTRLTDGAHHWYVANQDNLSTWDAFQTKFENTFVVKKSTSVKWREMTNRTQKKGENLDLYFHEKVKLCKELDLEFKEIKEQVLIGLWSKPMCDSLFTVRHFSIEQLLNDLREYENIEKERITRIYKPHSNYSNGLSRQPFRKENENSMINKPIGEPTQNVSVRPNKSTYLYVTTRNVNLTSDLNLGETNLKYFQQAFINGKPVKAYVDLGSQCVMLREGDAKEMNVNFEK